MSTRTRRNADDPLRAIHAAVFEEPAEIGIGRLAMNGIDERADLDTETPPDDAYLADIVDQAIVPALGLSPGAHTEAADAGRATLFLEVIERRDGASGFGAGNIRALFQAVEADQVRRGALIEREPAR